jgi:hypothetical protein
MSQRSKLRHPAFLRRPSHLPYVKDIVLASYVGSLTEHWNRLLIRIDDTLHPSLRAPRLTDHLSHSSQIANEISYNDRMARGNFELVFLAEIIEIERDVCHQLQPGLT